ncbi:hypothetical protein Tco_1390507 [Tanacetum coccineum]
MALDTNCRIILTQVWNDSLEFQREKEVKAIELLKQGDSIIVQDLKTNMYCEFRKFTSRDGESLDSYHSRPTNYTQSSSTRSQASTRNKRKEIAKTPSPTYDSEHDVVSVEEATPRDKEIKKLMDLILMSFKKIYKPTNNNLRTSSNTRNKNVDNTPKFDKRIGYDRQTGQYENQRVVNVAGPRDNVGTQQEEAEIQLSAEHVDWRDDIDDEPMELEAHYMYIAKIQEVIPDAADNYGPIFDTEPLEKVHNIDDNYNVFSNARKHPEQPESINDTYVMEKDDRNISPDSSDMCNDEREAGQDDGQAK